MTKSGRVVIPGEAHHLTQRGNNRQNVFTEEVDFRNYCFWMNKYAKKYYVNILAYCVMHNHVYFVAVPEKKDGLACLFQTVHMRYSKYFNHRHKMNGHVWQGRFYSCPLDEPHLVCAMRYVEQNPVRAGMVSSTWDYEWSSAKGHVGNKSSWYIMTGLKGVADRNIWQQYLGKEESLMDDMIRINTQMGLACAGSEVLNKWEQELNVNLRGKRARRLKKKN